MPPPMNAREYREHLYRSRTHPGDKADFTDNRDSFVTVYASLIPFLAVEYLAEISYDFVPAGLVFPVGWLLFWAFFYTYYKPDFLEDKLTSSQSLNPAAIVGVVVGVVIWFLKVTIVELADLLFLRWLRPKRKVLSSRQTKYNAVKPHPKEPGADPILSSRPVLPADVMAALQVMGLDATADWAVIHHRYRELAKKYHPDLNPEITNGHRFMVYDSAYHKLESVRARFFLSKTGS